MNNNGFEDALKQMKTIVDVNEIVAMDALEEAATYFIEKLEPVLLRSAKDKKHMADGLRIKIEKEQIVVYFENHAFYWYMKEHGHMANGKRVRGTHTINTTLNKESKKLEEIMLQKITKKMGF